MAYSSIFKTRNIGQRSNKDKLFRVQIKFGNDMAKFHKNLQKFNKIKFCRKIQREYVITAAQMYAFTMETAILTDGKSIKQNWETNFKPYTTKFHKGHKKRWRNKDKLKKSISVWVSPGKKDPYAMGGIPKNIMYRGKSISVGRVAEINDQGSAKMLSGGGIPITAKMRRWWKMPLAKGGFEQPLRASKKHIIIPARPLSQPSFELTVKTIRKKEFGVFRNRIHGALFKGGF